MDTVRRPVWRTFDPRFEANAVSHALAGGLSVVRGEPWRVLLPCDEDGLLTELVAWALLDLGVRGLSPGPDGVMTLRLPQRLRPRVEDLCERDATAPTSTVEVDYDCRLCAMCCRKNRVVLDPSDEALWRDAGRASLSGDAYVRTSRAGRRLLRVLASGDCVHLTGNDCGIYPLRPGNCRAFPLGSEGCLGAREDGGLA